MALTKASSSPKINNNNNDDEGDEVVSLLKYLSCMSQESLLFLEDLKFHNGNDEIAVARRAEVNECGVKLEFSWLRDTLQRKSLLDKFNPTLKQLETNNIPEKRTSPYVELLKQKSEELGDMNRSIDILVAEKQSLEDKIRCFENANMSLQIKNDLIESSMVNAECSHYDSIEKLTAQYEESKGEILNKMDLVKTNLNLIKSHLAKSEIQNKKDLKLFIESEEYVKVHDVLKGVIETEKDNVDKVTKGAKLEECIENLFNIYNSNFSLYTKYEDKIVSVLEELEKLLAEYNLETNVKSEQTGSREMIVNLINKLLGLIKENKNHRTNLCRQLSLTDISHDENNKNERENSCSDNIDDDANAFQLKQELLKLQVQLNNLKENHRELEVKDSELRNKFNELKAFQNDLQFKCDDLDSEIEETELKLDDVITNRVIENIDSYKSLDIFKGETVSLESDQLELKHEISSYQNRMTSTEILDSILMNAYKGNILTILEMVKQHTTQVTKSSKLILGRMDNLQSKLACCEDKIKQYLQNNLMKINFTKEETSRNLNELNSNSIEGFIDDTPDYYQLRVETLFKKSFQWNKSLESELLHISKSLKVIEEKFAFRKNNCEIITGEDILEKEPNNEKEFNVERVEIEEDDTIRKMKFEIGKLKAKLEEHRDVFAFNLELEKTVLYQRRLIEPYKTQLLEYEQERKDIMNRNKDIQNELDEKTLMVAQLSGHQNKKQKIQHVIQLLLKQRKLRLENERLEKDAEFNQKVIDDLYQEILAVKDPSDVNSPRTPSLSPYTTCNVKKVHSPITPVTPLTIPRSPLEKSDGSKRIKPRRISSVR